VWQLIAWPMLSMLLPVLLMMSMLLPMLIFAARAQTTERRLMTGMPCALEFCMVSTLS
jgi:hypothetical protein